MVPGQRGRQCGRCLLDVFRQFRVLEEPIALGIADKLKDWERGVTRTERGTDLVKTNEEIIPRTENDPLWESVMLIRDSLLHHRGIGAYVMPLKLTVPKFNRYAVEGTYRRHFDASPMGPPEMRTDFSCTLALNTDYEGGELHLETWQGDVLKAPRASPGIATIYECGEAHWVSPVTSGERVSAVMWMRSLVGNREQRDILRKFSKTLFEWEKQDRAVLAHDDEYTTLTGIQTALCRMWMDA